MIDLIKNNEFAVNCNEYITLTEKQALRKYELMAIDIATRELYSLLRFCLHCGDSTHRNLCYACYNQVHTYIKKIKSKPIDSICPHCLCSKKLELSNNSNKYLYDTDDYEWICIKCHVKKDSILRSKLKHNSMRIHNCRFRIRTAKEDAKIEMKRYKEWTKENFN